jgi:membrane carboxypeptidase/penicillin-binding protein
VQDAGGRELVDPHAVAPHQVVHPESAFLVTHMLRSVLNNGTAAAARTTLGFKEDAAGKTGTTNELRDAWFIGYTPDLLCAVWVGRDDNTPIRLTGARAALPIWVDFMKQALDGRPARQFTAPAENVVFVDIDPDTGDLATPWCPKTFPEAFVAGTEPRQPCLQHAPFGGGSDEPPELGPSGHE